MRSTIRCCVCSTCLAALFSPDSAGGGLGRARAVSLRGVPFSFFCQNIAPVNLCVWNHINLICATQENGWLKSSWHSMRVSGRGFDARSAFFFFWCAVFSELFLLGTVCALTKEYLDLIDCNYATELYPAVRRTSMHVYIPAIYFCCCSVCCYNATACRCLLLLFVIVCRMAKFVAVVHASDPSAFFVFIRIHFTFNLGKLTKSGIPGWFLNKIGYLFFRDGARLRNLPVVCGIFRVGLR